MIIFQFFAPMENISLAHAEIYDNNEDKETFTKYREIIDNIIINDLWRFFSNFI